LLVAGKSAGVAPEDSVLGDVFAEVGLVLHLPGFEEADLGADQFLLNVGETVALPAWGLGVERGQKKSERDQGGCATRKALFGRNVGWFIGCSFWHSIAGHEN